MSDRYPKHFEIEIQREALRRYFRTTWLLSTLGATALIAMIFALFTIESATGGDENSRSGILSVFAILGGGGLFVVLTTALLYWGIGRRHTRKAAKDIHVRVEGPYLRVVQDGFVRRNRKLHFSALVDYSVVEGALMRRFGIKELRMTTAAIGEDHLVRIPAVKNCEAVRDMLAEIDSHRELE